jgi:hypothetical protein
MAQNRRTQIQEMEEIRIMQFRLFHGRKNRAKLSKNQMQQNISRGIMQLKFSSIAWTDSKAALV